jgi:exodeoxyribonuclease V gamma subunit
VLHIHRAERADGLVAALGAVLTSPLDDPMQAEVVAVPTRGVERWLTQRLSGVLGTSPGRADGVCANVEFPFPGTLVTGAVATAAGIDREADPWLPARSVWSLLEVVEASLDEPWLAPLARYLRGAGADADAARRRRRLSTVRHIADLYDRYAVHRPELLRAWVDGDDHDWQAELWRRLRAHIGDLSPAERLDDACARLRSEPALVDLPPRISLFGLTRFPASYLDVLHALAVTRDVHLFLLHPSAALWEQIAAVTRDREPIVRREEDVTATLPQNPLLASWAQDAREMQLVLATRPGAAVVHEHVVVEEQRTTLLARIQGDIRADRTPPGLPIPGAADERVLLEPDDRSLQVHGCHGRARQVEVVRDAILHLLAEDPTFEPRDIVVMCPDIEVFAPLVHATFGAATGGDEEADSQRIDLHVRLADRSLRQTNPVLSVVAQLLDLAGGRLTASQVLDLAGRGPVRRRFRLDDDDLARLAEWARESGVRWGLDAAQRAPYRLDRVAANTWQTGWDRVLVGVAMAEEAQRLFGGVLPLDDVGSSDIDLAGRFAEFLARLHSVVGAFAESMPLDAWATAIADAADSLTAASGDGAWQRLQLGRLLEDVVAEGTTAGPHAPGAPGAPGAVGVTQTPLTLPEIRALLADRLRGRPTRASFRTGHLTICTLVPMRSVPHRVVCLMGLDDGVFPRQTARDGDDLLLRDPHVGDRDPRTEDRQLLLDAVLAAKDNLVITYAARDERTNLRRPPAVPLGELLEVVDRTARTADGATAREHVVVEHPLQPFDLRNFEKGGLVPERTWGFDHVALDGARALVGDRQESPPFLAEPLPRTETRVIELGQLVRFVQRPVREFLRGRLGVAAAARDDDVKDALSVELNALEQWGVGQRLLEARLAGADMDACIAVEIARGELPPESLAQPVLVRVRPIVEKLVTAAARYVPKAGASTSLDVKLELPERHALVGTVTGICGELVATVTYSRVAPRHRLAAWVYLLALAAARPATAYEAITIGRRRDDAPRNLDVTVAHIRLPNAPDARRAQSLRHLAVLVDLFERGMGEPLPLYCNTSAAYAAAVAAGKDGRTAAAKGWTSAKFPGEDVEPEHRLVLGATRTLDELFDATPHEDEQGESWALDERTRFGRYARRLWDDLLAHEELIDS